MGLTVLKIGTYRQKDFGTAYNAQEWIEQLSNSLHFLSLCFPTQMLYPVEEYVMGESSLTCWRNNLNFHLALIRLCTSAPWHIWQASDFSTSCSISGWKGIMKCLMGGTLKPQQTGTRISWVQFSILSRAECSVPANQECMGSRVTIDCPPIIYFTPSTIK